MKQIDFPVLNTLLETSMKGNSATDYQDVAKILTLMLYLKFLVPTLGHILGWYYLSYVDNLDNMKKYNWTDFIMEALIGSIRKSNNNPKHVAGCVMILLVSSLSRYTFFLRLCI